MLTKNPQKTNSSIKISLNILHQLILGSLEYPHFLIKDDYQEKITDKLT